MGIAASIVDDLALRSATSSYLADRSKLREDLIISFDNNPDNQDLLKKIIVLQDLLTVHPHICSTAERELQNKTENAPTNVESAFRYVFCKNCTAVPIT